MINLHLHHSNYILFALYIHDFLISRMGYRI